VYGISGIDPWDEAEEMKQPFLLNVYFKKPMLFLVKNAIIPQK